MTGFPIESAFGKLQKIMKDRIKNEMSIYLSISFFQFDLMYIIRNTER